MKKKQSTRAPKLTTKNVKKRARAKKFRSAKSGRYTTKRTAERHPSTTVGET